MEIEASSEITKSVRQKFVLEVLLAIEEFKSNRDEIPLVHLRKLQNLGKYLRRIDSWIR